MNKKPRVQKVDWDSYLFQLETLIVNGRHQQCRSQLHTVDTNRLPLAVRSRLAELAWRVNSYLFALKILRPVIYPISYTDAPAKSKEMLVYGACLSSLGATREAKRILKKIDHRQEPESLFHLAGTAISDWNYKNAVVYLKRYISNTAIPVYRQLVGMVNLAAAYTTLGQWLEAKKLLSVIQEKCEEGSYHLLLGNCHELRAQVELCQGNYSVARHHLFKARGYLSGQHGQYMLYVEKWLAVCDCLERNSEEQLKSGIQSLYEVQQKAQKLKHWNTLRDCDLFLSIATGNENLMQKVIMGTPSKSYRDRAHHIFGVPKNLAGRFCMPLISKIDSRAEFIEFDPQQTTVLGETLMDQPLLYALMAALLRDHYQPQTFTMLFERIYPTEKFDPYHSPFRVLRLLRRLDQWFRRNQLPIRIHFHRSEYNLTATANVRIFLNRHPGHSAKTARYAKYKKYFGGQKFTINDLTLVMGRAKVTAERWLREALSAGLLVKERTAKGVVYRFIPQRRTFRSVA